MELSGLGIRALACRGAVIAAASIATLWAFVPPAAASTGGREAIPASCSGSNADDWIGGSGTWEQGSNWSKGAPPSGSAEACITVPGSSVTLSNEDTGPASLVLGGSSGATVSLAVESSDTAASVLSVTANSVIEPTGSLSLVSGADSSTDAATFSVRSPAILNNFGVIETSGDSDFLQGNVTNRASGTATLDGITSTNTGNYVNSGAWSVGASGAMNFDPTSFTQAGGTLDNLGTIDVNTGTGASNGFTMSGGKEEGNPVALTFTPFNDQKGSGSFQLIGSESILGVIPPGQTVTVLSTASSEGSTDLDAPGVTIEKAGKLVLDDTSAGAADDLGGSTLTNEGTFQVEAAGKGVTVGAPVTNDAGATIEATGTGFVMNNTLTNDGILQLGTGTDLTLNGFTLTEDSGATLGLQVGTAAGTTSKVTDSSATTMDLNGTLKVTTDGTITTGESFLVIFLAQAGSSVSGTFSTIRSTSGTYSPSYKTTSVRLNVVKP